MNVTEEKRKAALGCSGAFSAEPTIFSSSLPTENVSEYPLLVNVSGRCEGEVDGGEEQVRRGQTDHEQGGGVGTELGAPEECHNGQEVAWKRIGEKKVKMNPRTDLELGQEQKTRGPTELKIRCVGQTETKTCWRASASGRTIAASISISFALLVTSLDSS